MSRFIIATIKSWNIENFYRLRKAYPQHDFMLITDKNKFTEDIVKEYSPRYIFFPHWSWIIPKEIFNRYESVVFHMTDLPFGRGGSPLQNLLVRGIYETKISALRVCEDIDAGPIYLKEPLDISDGSADEILKRASDIIYLKMIPRFLNGEIVPTEQTGDIEIFKRRTPEQSEIPLGLSQREIYDYIRMLDGEGYPKAFIKYGDKKIIFESASYEDGVVKADCRWDVEKK